MLGRLLRGLARGTDGDPGPASEWRPASHEADGLDAALATLRGGGIEEAARAARAALSRDPDRADALFLLGMVAQVRGDPDAALERFRETLERAPGHRDAALKSGMILRERGRYAEALGHFDAVLGTASDAMCLNERAVARMGLRRLAEAESDLRQAIALEPDFADALGNLGIVLSRTGRAAEAVEMLRRALVLDPQSGALRCNLAAALRECDAHDEALALLDEALATDPELSDARLIKGLLLRELGRPGEAKALLAPLADLGEAACNLGLALQDLGRMDEALEAFERARGEGSRAHQAIRDRGMLRLLQGDFREGWRDYAHRLEAGDAPLPDYGGREWFGESLEGRTLAIFAEQGLGDEVMFASCIPDVMRRGGRVLLQCDPRLGALFARSFPPLSVLAVPRSAGPGAALRAGRADYQIAAGGLPGLFRTRREDFPGTPFLAADPARVAAWRERLLRLPPGLRVGLAWRGGTARTRAAVRAVPPGALAPLLARPRARFVSLQHDARDDELAQLAGGSDGRFEHWPEALRDIDETVALLASLDLIVTVCQTLVHLCGGVGRPCWVLVPRVPEWRYGLEGPSMPWYGSIRMFRQTRVGDWSGPLAQALDVLGSGLANAGSGP